MSRWPQVSVDDEAAVAGGIVADPEKAVPYAWATLRPDDFEDEAYRWLFGLLVEAWHRSEGIFEPGPHYREFIALMYARQFDLPQELGFVWLEELEGWDLGDTAFRAYCDRLAAWGAVRRTREAVGRWYVAISNAGSGRGGVGVEPVSFRDPLSARDYLAGLLRAVRAAVRRAPVVAVRGKSREKGFTIGRQGR